MTLRKTLLALVLLATPAMAAVDLQWSESARGQAFRKVHIAPARVEFERDAVGRGAQPRLTGKLSPGEAERFAADLAESFRAALAKALQERGYEVAAAAGSDTVRIVPALRHVRINAPEALADGMTRHYVREAGQATLEVEALDASGRRLFAASEPRVVGRTHDFRHASDVDSRFWFDSTFRRWSEDLARTMAQSR